MKLSKEQLFPNLSEPVFYLWNKQTKTEKNTSISVASLPLPSSYQPCPCLTLAHTPAPLPATRLPLPGYFTGSQKSLNLDEELSFTLTFSTLHLVNMILPCDMLLWSRYQTIISSLSVLITCNHVSHDKPLDSSQTTFHHLLIGTVL